MWRQGDVLIVKNERAVPTEAKVVADKVLVYGEATGHAHRVEGALVRGMGDERFISATSEFRVVHDEHDTIVIPEGEYRIVRQREFDGEQIRVVYD